MLSPWWTIAAAGALLLVFLESLQVHIVNLSVAKLQDVCWYVYMYEQWMKLKKNVVQNTDRFFKFIHEGID